MGALAKALSCSKLFLDLFASILRSSSSTSSKQAFDSNLLEGAFILESSMGTRLGRGTALEYRPHIFSTRMYFTCVPQNTTIAIPRLEGRKRIAFTTFYLGIKIILLEFITLAW